MDMLDAVGMVLPADMFNGMYENCKFIVLVNDKNEYSYGNEVKKGIMEKEININSNYAHGGIEVSLQTNISERMTYENKYVGYYDVRILDDANIYIDRDLFKINKIEITSDLKTLDQLECFINNDDFCESVVKKDPFMIKYIKYCSNNFYKKIVGLYPNLFEKMDTYDKEIILAAVKKNGKLLKHAKYQDLEICEEAINNDPSAIEFANYQSKNIALSAVVFFGMNLKYILEQDLEICEFAVFNAYKAFEFAKFQSPELCKIALEKDGMLLKYVINKTEELCDVALNNNIGAFEFYENPSEKVQLNVMKINGMMLRFIENQSDDVIDVALKQNIHAFKFIKNQSEEMCRKIFDENHRMIKYFNVQPNDLCVIAITEEPKLLQFIKPEFQTLEICKISVDSDVNMLKYACFQNEEMCLNCVKKKGTLLEFVECQTIEICREAINHSVSAISFAKYQDIKMAYFILSHNVDLLKYVNDEFITEEIQMMIIHDKAYNFRLIKNPTYETLKYVLSKSGYYLSDIPPEKHTEELVLIAIDGYPHGITFTHLRSEKIAESVLTKQPFHMNKFDKKYITYELCLKIVASHGRNLEHIPVEFMTDELCTTAVYECTDALRYVKNPSKELIMYGISKDGDFLSLLDDKDKTYELCMQAVSTSGRAIKHVPYRFQTNEICEIAIDKYHFALDDIINPTDEVCIKAIKKNSTYNEKFLKNKSPRTKIIGIINGTSREIYDCDNEYKLAEIIHSEHKINIYKENKMFYLMGLLLNPKGVKYLKKEEIKNLDPTGEYSDLIAKLEKIHDSIPKNITIVKKYNGYYDERDEYDDYDDHLYDEHHDYINENKLCKECHKWSTYCKCYDNVNCHNCY